MAGEAAARQDSADLPLSPPNGKGAKGGGKGRSGRGTRELACRRCGVKLAELPEICVKGNILHEARKQILCAQNFLKKF